MDRLLEGALGEVGGDQIWEAHQEGCRDAADRGLVAEHRERGQGGEDGDGDREAVETLDQADAEALVQGDDDRVRAHRVALVEELGAGASGEVVCREQVLGHVRVEAGAEDAEMAFDGKGQRGGGEAHDGHRKPGSQRLPPAFDPSPQKEKRPDDQARTTIAETMPCPDRRTVAQQIAPSRPRPIAGDSHDQRRPPQSATAACPMAGEAAHTATTAA